MVKCNYMSLFDIFVNPEHRDNPQSFLAGDPYEPHVVKYFQSMVSGKRVLDIGSNIGFYSLLAIHCGASHVFSVEPNKEDNGLLRRSLEANLFAGKTTLFPNAASDINGMARFTHDKDSSNGTLQPYGEEFVKLFRLDDHAAELGAIDVIKIDVEGHELHTMRGATKVLLSRPIVFSEFYPRCLREHGTIPERYLELWFNSGYQVSVLDKPSHREIHCDSVEAVMSEHRKRAEIETEYIAYLDILCRS